ncbi:MAG: hypothetical protein CVV23_14620 [Ignavibacteriae bacterium HGW-Ignavibacteriae-2]|nr:MAG: hypothetical protein CVV23_14620 [Ignavibacteriae bacterium HGW-Ignavibacteriae-2]
MSSMQKMILSTILITILFIGCGKNQPMQKSNKINSVVTLITYKDFVESIGGAEVVVTSLIPPGANPHAFEPVPDHIKQMSDADVYFKVGGNFHFEEELMSGVSVSREKLTIIDCSTGIKIINNNPHVWLGPDQVKIILKNIYSALVRFKPDKEEYFNTNLERFLTKLDSLETQFKNKFNAADRKTFVVYHEAWGYYANHFNLVELAVEKEGKEPNVYHMKNIVEEAKKNKIKVIFSEPQTNRQSALAVAHEIGANIDFINPHPAKYLNNFIEVSNKLLESFK